MDTITHAVAGAAIATAARDRVGTAGAAAILAASVAQDADFFLRFFGSGTYLQYHRVVLNSIPGAIAISVVCALAGWWFSGRKNLLALFGLCLGAAGLHSLMDLTNSYGAVPLWPYDESWRAMDIVFIIDPWVTLLLVAAIVAMKKYGRRSLVLAVCLVLLVSYWGMRGYMHHNAVGICKLRYPDAVKVGAFPSPVNPFKWRMVAETEQEFWAGRYNLLTGNEETMQVYLKQRPDKVMYIAQKKTVTKMFMKFARFPYITYIQNGNGWTVTIQDLRFTGFGSGKRFLVRVKVFPDGTSDDGEFSFSD